MQNKKIFIIPFDKKDDIKKRCFNKLLWDNEIKKWYINLQYTFGTMYGMNYSENPKSPFYLGNYVQDEILDKYEITYLEVDFKDKDKVKSLGAIWDKYAKKWYIEGILELHPQKDLLQKLIKNDCDTTYLNVDFKDKDQVKSLGAKWNKELKKWYIKGYFDEHPNFHKLKKFHPNPSLFENEDK